MLITSHKLDSNRYVTKEHSDCSLAGVSSSHSTDFLQTKSIAFSFHMDGRFYQARFQPEDFKALRAMVDGLDRRLTEAGF